MLGKSKLNSIEILISQALIDLGISHEEFKQFLMKKRSMKKWNDIRMNQSSDDLNKDESKKN